MALRGAVGIRLRGRVAVAGHLVHRLAGAERPRGLRLPVGQGVAHDHVLARHRVARAVGGHPVLGSVRGLWRGAPGDEHVVGPEGGDLAWLVERRGVTDRVGVRLRRLGVVLRARPGVLPGGGELTVHLVLDHVCGLARLVGILASGLDETLVEGVDQTSHVVHGHAETRGAHLTAPQAQHQRAFVPSDPEHPLLATLVKEHLAERRQRDNFRHGRHSASASLYSSTRPQETLPNRPFHPHLPPQQHQNGRSSLTFGGLASRVIEPVCHGT